MRFTKLKLTIAFLAIILSGSKIQGQSSSETSLYNWFDNTIGKENLDINNGKIHVNPYKTLNGNNMYYLTDKYSKGEVAYKNQTYTDVKIKYDIYKDELILNPYGESDYIGINIIQEKTNSFSINGKTFINLSDNNTTLPEYVKGYYEINLVKNSNVFYIKHHKNMRELIIDNKLINEFEERNEFLLKYKNVFYKVVSKKDLTKIFPEYEIKISDYYSKNKDLENSDKTKFMENLMRYINFL